MSFPADLYHMDDRSLLELGDPAHGNDPHAQLVLGHRCREADHPEDAYAWYRRAAEQANPIGQNNLGLCYKSGYGTAQNLAEAECWFRKSARQEYALGEFNLAILLRNTGTEAGFREALHWFEQSSAHGNLAAKIQLAHHLIAGPDFIHNVARGARLYADVITSSTRKDAKLYAAAKKQLRELFEDATHEMNADTRIQTKFPDGTTAQFEPDLMLGLFVKLVSSRKAPKEDAAPSG
jgi:hypothetical protein